MNTIKIINLVVFFALCGTCFTDVQGIARYKARSLEVFTHETLRQDEVGFRYKIFNKKDCKTYLGRRNIISKKYTPIQMSITNNTNKSFQFSLDNVSLSSVSYNEVAHQVCFSTARRIFGWLVPWGFFMVPLYLLTLFAGLLTIEQDKAEQARGNFIGGLWKYVVGLLVFPTLAIAVPPTVAAKERAKSPQAQKQLLTDYESKALKDTVIKPFNTVNGVLFVKTKELKDFFSLTLVDTYTNERYTLSTDVPSIGVRRSNHVFFPLFKNPY